MSRFVWYDLVTPDLAAAQEFYSQLLGWTVQCMGDYPMFFQGEKGVGGVTQGTPHWQGYALVDSVQASLVRAEELGGRVLKPATDLPGGSCYGVFRDPQGAELALYQTSQQQAPEERGPGHFCWHQLLTTDVAAAAEFYQALLGYGLRIVEGCQLLLNGVEDYAGIMERPVAGPPEWVHYLHCLDPDGLSARVAELGGRVFVPAQDHPGMGRLAVVADPQGARFALYRPTL